MTGTDVIKAITLTKTGKDGKVSTMTITDSNGNGIFDSNDKFKVNGDSSLFTVKDIKVALPDYKIESKTDGGADEITKDANGKVIIKKDTEYRAGSLVDSFFTADKAATPSPSSNAAYNASMALSNSQIACWGVTLPAMSQMAFATHDNTGYYQSLQSFTDVVCASLRNWGRNPAFASTPAPVTEAPTPVESTKTEKKETTSPDDTPFAEDVKSEEKAPEEKAPVKTEPKIEEKTSTKTEKKAATIPLSRVEAERVKKEAQAKTMSDAYRNSSEAQKTIAEIKELQEKQSKATGRGTMYCSVSIKQAQAHLEDVQSGKIAKAKEAEMLNIVEKINGLMKKYNDYSSRADFSMYKEDFLYQIREGKKQLASLGVQLSDYETTQSPELQLALANLAGSEEPKQTGFVIKK